MKKNLRYSLLGLLLAFCIPGGAQTTVIDFDNNYATLFPTLTGTSSSESHDGDFTETTTSTPVDGITVTVSAKTSGSNENRIWNAAPRLRMYSGTFTVTAPAGKNISSIEFTGHNTNFNLETGTGTLDAKTWTGSANEIVFTVKKNTQINNITVTIGGGGTVEPQPMPEVSSIADFKALANGKEAKLTLTNAKVVYSWTSNNGNTSVYVRDASGAIVFDCRGDYAAVGASFATNNDLNGSIILKNSLYNNLPQASATSKTNVDNLTISAGSSAAPVECTVANAKDYLCDLVTVKGVSVTSDGAEKPKYYATAGADQVQIYNGFHLDAFNDLSTFVGENVAITGIMVVYNTTYEIYPIDNGIDTGISNVTSGALNANAPIYNLAGQRVSKDAKGILIQNGKKFVK